MKTENHKFRNSKLLKLTKATSMFKKSAKETNQFKVKNSSKIKNEIAPITIYIVEISILTSLSLLSNNVGSFVLITLENPKSKK